LLLFFFIDLGAKLDFSTLGSEVGAALVLSAFVLIGNPLIVMAIMGTMGYRKRTSFLAGLTVAQISEFSIIFVAMGISLGHISASVLGLTTLVGLITIALSSYMILYSHRLYGWLAPWLGVFERRTPFRELAVENSPSHIERPDVVVFGLGRYGSRLALKLQQQGMRVLGVDFDPEVIKAQQRSGLDARFGDCEAPDFIESLPLAGVPWVVSSLPEADANRALLHALTAHHFSGRLAVVARHQNEVEALTALGQVEVIQPFNQAADFAALDIAARIAKAEVCQQNQANPTQEPS